MDSRTADVRAITPVILFPKKKKGRKKQIHWIVIHVVIHEQTS